MARIGDGGDLLKCSFCGKSQKQVKKLIAGPGVYICNQCIDLCNNVIREEVPESPSNTPRCPACHEVLGDRATIHVIAVGDENVRVLACGGCGRVLGTLP